MISFSLRLLTNCRIRKLYDIKTYQSNHYVFKMNDQIIDSLPEDRQDKPDYFENSYFNLHLRRR